MPDNFRPAFPLVMRQQTINSRTFSAERIPKAVKAAAERRIFLLERDHWPAHRKPSEVMTTIARAFDPNRHVVRHAAFETVRVPSIFEPACLQ